MDGRVSVHPTADIADGARVGDGTVIWHESQIREGAVVGRQCTIGKGVYIDAGVRVGDRVKAQNGVSLFRGVTLEDGVFCGPHATFTNDLHPRAIRPDGSAKGTDDWQVMETVVRTGASIGANATIVCGITIGRWAVVGAGAVVTRDVPDHALVLGNPARVRGFVCACGARLQPVVGASGQMRCEACGTQVAIAGGGG